MPKKYSLNLALQGGGAHGAYTWGVLDRLLEDDCLELGWVSGTSAGAVNAVALAAGLAEGSRQKAREKLYKVWEAVHKAGVPSDAVKSVFVRHVALQLDGASGKPVVAL